MILASCVVEPDGQLVGLTFGVEQVTRNSSGRYLVDFTFRLTSGVQILIVPRDPEATSSTMWKMRPCDSDELPSDSRCEVETFVCRCGEAREARGPERSDCGFSLVALMR